MQNESETTEDVLDLNYRQRIQGEPGSGVAMFLKVVAAIEVLLGIYVAVSRPEAVAGFEIFITMGSIVSAAILYGFAIVMENVIAIRIEAEFQSECMDVSGLEDSGLAP